MHNEKKLKTKTNKLAFHDANTDTDIDSPNTATILRPTHAISSRGSLRECRRVVQLATAITSGSVGCVGEDPREDVRVGVGVGVGVVEFQLYRPIYIAEPTCNDRRPQFR